MPDTDTEGRDRGLHRHGEVDPSGWDEQPAVTGRVPDASPDNSTFASRKMIAAGENKQVDAPDETKAVRPARKRPARKAEG